MSPLDMLAAFVAIYLFGLVTIWLVCRLAGAVVLVARSLVRRWRRIGAVVAADGPADDNELREGPGR